MVWLRAIYIYRVCVPTLLIFVFLRHPHETFYILLSVITLDLWGKSSNTISQLSDPWSAYKAAKGNETKKFKTRVYRKGDFPNERCSRFNYFFFSSFLYLALFLTTFLLFFTPPPLLHDITNTLPAYSFLITKIILKLPTPFVNVVSIFLLRWQKRICNFFHFPFFSVL